MGDLINLGRLSKCYFTGDQVKTTVRVKIPEKVEKRIRTVEISLRIQEQTKMRCKENSKMFEHKKTVHKKKHSFTVTNTKGEQRETFVFDTSMNFPPSIPLPAPLPQYAWYDTLFSIKYELIVKGVTTIGEEVKILKTLKFLPGFDDEFFSPGNEKLAITQFKGPQQEIVKKLPLKRGQISCVCKLNKPAFLLASEDKPVISLRVKNTSKSKIVKAVQFALSHKMSVKGWNWNGKELTQKKVMKVPLSKTEHSLEIKPQNEQEVTIPIQIKEDSITQLPPTFETKAIHLQYYLTACFIAGSERLECTLPVQFIVPDLSPFLIESKIRSSLSGSNPRAS